MPLRRMNSQLLGKKIDAQGAEIFVLMNKELKLLSLSNLDEVLPIGRGTQGKVYPAVIGFQNDSGDFAQQKYYRICVLKEMRGRHPKDVAYFLKHSDITRLHETSTEENIIKLMSVQVHDGDNLAVLPYCGLFLDRVIAEFSKSDHPETLALLREIIILHVMSDVVHAVKHMHDNGFVHGDIKGENIAYYRGHFCVTDL